MQPDQLTQRAFLRHALATIAYRTGKTLRSAPANFANFKVGDESRTPVEILAHMTDLMGWSLTLLQNQGQWSASTPQDWTTEVERFYHHLKKLDDFLASDEPLHGEIERLFQGPIADALTHTGQLAMLRHLAGSPIQGENYFVADVVVGTVGLEQAQAKKVF